MTSMVGCMDDKGSGLEERVLTFVSQLVRKKVATNLQPLWKRCVMLTKAQTLPPENTTEELRCWLARKHCDRKILKRGLADNGNWLTGGERMEWGTSQLQVYLLLLITPVTIPEWPPNGVLTGCPTLLTIPTSRIQIVKPTGVNSLTSN